MSFIYNIINLSTFKSTYIILCILFELYRSQFQATRYCIFKYNRNFKIFIRLNDFVIDGISISFDSRVIINKWCRTRALWGWWRDDPTLAIAAEHWPSAALLAVFLDCLGRSISVRACSTTAPQSRSLSLPVAAAAVSSGPWKTRALRVWTDELSESGIQRQLFREQRVVIYGSTSFSQRENTLYLSQYNTMCYLLKSSDIILLTRYRIVMSKSSLNWKQCFKSSRVRRGTALMQ